MPSFFVYNLVFDFKHFFIICFWQFHYVFRDFWNEQEIIERNMWPKKKVEEEIKKLMLEDKTWRSLLLCENMQSVRFQIIWAKSNFKIKKKVFNQIFKIQFMIEIFV